MAAFKKVNQKGETKNYPENEPGWSGEISLDLDMVSAACSECHILLVEANGDASESAFITNMVTAEEEAVTLKATEISNSWDTWESSGDSSYDKYFDHPGIPITVASGDYGYTKSLRWPGSSPYVISTGGTKLTKAENSRGWSEEVWRTPSLSVGVHGAGTTSGCATYEAKPLWQSDPACGHRMVADVAADAAVESPVSVYDSYEESGWVNYGGTSAAAPFVAGVEALSTSFSRSLDAEAFYIAGRDGSLFDVTKGSDGTCTPPAEDEYFCTATTGYDGPTGWGAPDGALEVANIHEATNVTLNEGTDQTTLYYREETGKMGYWQWNAGTGWSHTSVGGNIAEGTTPVVTLKSSSGQTTVYYEEAGGGIGYWQWNAGTWSHTSLGGSTLAGAGPAVTFTQSTGQTTVYYREESGEMGYRQWNAGTWAHATHGGSVAGATTPTAILNESIGGQTTVFYQEAGGSFGYWQWNGTSGWSHFTV